MNHQVEKSGIFRDKTKDNKWMYFHNDDNQINPAIYKHNWLKSLDTINLKPTKFGIIKLWVLV